LVVDDETDVAELFRQQFRREARQGTYVLHFAYPGEEALGVISGLYPGRVARRRSRTDRDGRTPVIVGAECAALFRPSLLFASESNYAFSQTELRKSGPCGAV
jgi:hypothetical protein